MPLPDQRRAAAPPTLADVDGGERARRGALARAPGPRRASTLPAEVADVARHPAHGARPHPGQPRRAGDPAGLAHLRALVDPRRRDDVVGAAAAGPRRGRARVPRAGTRRSSSPDGKVPCCVDARRRPGARARQQRRVRLRRRRVLSLHPRRRPRARACGRTCARAVDYMEQLRAASAPTPTATPGRARLSSACCRRRSATRATRDKPVHSYWDDFWACAAIAGRRRARAALGDADDARAHAPR